MISGRPASLTSAVEVRQDGTLLAWEFHNYNSGRARAWQIALRGPQPPGRLSPLHATCCRQGAYRALASPSILCPRDAHGRVAAGLSWDPVQFRLKYILKDEPAAGRPRGGRRTVRLGGPATGRGVVSDRGRTRRGVTRADTCAEVRPTARARCRVIRT